MEMPQIFENKEFGKIRVVEHSGTPWFVGKDVCDCLEIGNSRDAAASLDDDEKGVALIDTPGGKQEMSIISEPGLYSLVLRSRSRKPRPSSDGSFMKCFPPSVSTAATSRPKSWKKPCSTRMC